MRAQPDSLFHTRSLNEDDEELSPSHYHKQELSLWHFNPLRFLMLLLQHNLTCPDRYIDCIIIFNSKKKKKKEEEGKK